MSIARGAGVIWFLKIAQKIGTSAEQVGRAMLTLAKHGGPKAVFENADINADISGA